VPDTSAKATKVFIGAHTQYNDLVYVKSGDAERRQIKSGNVLWVFGTASYADDFGDNHEVDYRFYYDFARKLFITAQEGNASRFIGRSGLPLASPPPVADPQELPASETGDQP
jgi:hypothetical protein